MVERPLSAGVLWCALSATQSAAQTEAATRARLAHAEALAALAEARIEAGADNAVDEESNDGPVAEAKARVRVANNKVSETRLKWKLNALQVKISPTFVPSGPLQTWHDTEPFGPEPEPEPEPEQPPTEGKKK